MNAGTQAIQATNDEGARADSARPAEAVELFVSDVHGEYETFAQVVRGGCGAVRRAVDAVFAGELDDAQRAALATLAVRPQERISRAQAEEADPAGWLDVQAARMDRLAAHVGASCEAGLPAQERIAALAPAVCERLVTRVHMVGDVFDRGPAPDACLDEMAGLPALDIQWGNHDILWMGAALGQPGCVANVVRICARYGNLDVLEHTYGIDLAPLRAFAASAYADDPCAGFGCKGSPGLEPDELRAAEQVQKAMAIIQFKVEAALIAGHPDFGLDARNLLHRIDFAAGTVDLDGTVHPLLDTRFPTVDPADPYRLTSGESDVIDHLQRAFRSCGRLQRHVDLLLTRGSLYRVSGDDLLFHACVPLAPGGSALPVTVFGQTYAGRALFDAVDRLVRDAFRAQDAQARRRGADLIWWLWLGAGSPLFAKSKMATFELYLVADKAARKEEKNPFYALRDDPDVVAGILRDFGVDPARGRIVCGHVPVKVKDGEDPVKCGGRVIDIDGGMSRPYQSSTGIGGMALLRDDRGLNLALLRPYPGTREAVEADADVTFELRAL